MQGFDVEGDVVDYGASAVWHRIRRERCLSSVVGIAGTCFSTLRFSHGPVVVVAAGLSRLNFYKYDFASSCLSVTTRNKAVECET